MRSEPDLSVPAAALGDPARGRIVAALMGGREVPASDLARVAGVSASTASEHLRILREAGLVEVHARGRNRFYRLASDEVSRAVEALQAIAPRVPVTSLRSHRVSEQLQAARTCYDHLAGDLGLRLADLLVRDGAVPALAVGATADAPSPFPDGPIVVALGLQQSRGVRPWARGCLDWSGRRPHVAGQAGAQMLLELERKQWIERRTGSRAVTLTPAGADGLDALDRG